MGFILWHGVQTNMAGGTSQIESDEKEKFVYAFDYSLKPQNVRSDGQLSFNLGLPLGLPRVDPEIHIYSFFDNVKFWVDPDSVKRNFFVAVDFYLIEHPEAKLEDFLKPETAEEYRKFKKLMSEND